MANAEHLSILKQGVEVWHEWRMKNRAIKPDLYKANLSGANLSHFDFHEAHLYEAILEGADLSSSDLHGATLIGANLSGTNLSRANLNTAHCLGANFYRAFLAECNVANTTLVKCNLYQANLSGAILSGANVSGSILRDANLIKATLLDTNFSGADLMHVNLSGSKLNGANFRGSNLNDAILESTTLINTDFSGASLQRVNLSRSHLNFANFTEANLIEADLNNSDLSGADLSDANLTRADLTDSRLTRAILVETKLTNAIISNCKIFGISAWNLDLEGAIQDNFVITQPNEPIITVDNLEVAQFVYLLLHNEKIRDVINTIGQKAVLILGRFAIPERKEVLEAMRERLRQNGFLPIVFDFEKSEERDFTETIKTLAGMSLFVIADITNPKSSPLELQATVPDYMIPFVPIIQANERPFSMFTDLQHKYKGVLDVRQYNDKDHLLSNFENGIIKPALAKRKELLILKNETLKIRSIEEN